MNVYDFDNTIYDGECSVDFFCFCISKKKSLIRYFPLVFYALALYKLNLLDEERVNKIVKVFSKSIVENRECRDSFVREFWIKNEYKLKEEFLSKLSSEDVIITGAPNVLIDGIRGKLNTNNIICSLLDLETGCLKFHCFGDNKVKAFREFYPKGEIDEFYTDSMSDKPMMDIARRVYVVKK